MSQKPLCECNQRIAVLENAYIRAGWREHDLRVELHAAKQKLAVLDQLLLRITGSDHQDSLRAIGEAAAISASAEPSDYLKSCEAAHRALSLEPSAPVERGSTHGFEQSPNTCRHLERSGVWWREGSITRTGRECNACGSVIEDPATEACMHEFIPFTKGCSKCGEPYSTEGASHE